MIVSWNGQALLERFLPSVVGAAGPADEIVVADNASTDGSVAWLARSHPGVGVVVHPENWLFARGNNAAVPATTGDVLVFLNNDVEVTPGWLDPLVTALAEPGIVAVQPKLLQHADRGRFEYAGASGGFLDRHGIPFTRGRLFDTMERDKGQYDDPRDVFWATGAALAVRRDAFVSAGGFDEAFGMHMEEIDLCWRLQRAGGRIRVAPSSQVFHLGGASLPQGSPRKTYLNYRNNLVMLAKNLPEEVRRPILRERRVLDAAAAARAMVARRPAEARAIRRAWADFAAVRPDLPRPADGERLIVPTYRRSVVADYYARGRRRFSDLPADGWLDG